VADRRHYACPEACRDRYPADGLYCRLDDCDRHRHRHAIVALAQDAIVSNVSLDVA
jgi:hypothetical protein